VASTYGAAGSLGVLLIWIFCSTQLFFLGAEFTQVYGRTYGSRWREHDLLAVPAPEAPPPTEEATERQPDEGVDGARLAAPGPLQGWQRRTFTQPLTHLAIAIGIIAAISIFNLIRAPFHK
jgi:hypothetical protein